MTEFNDVVNAPGCHACLPYKIEQEPTEEQLTDAGRLVLLQAMGSEDRSPRSASEEDRYHAHAAYADLVIKAVNENDANGRNALARGSVIGAGNCAL